MAVGGCGGRDDDAESLLGVKLPAAVDEARSFRWQPSEEISFYTGYVRLGGPREALLAVVDDLDLHRYGDQEALGLLPTSWQTHPQVALDWWDASTETPPDSWAGPFGVAGRIVAKLERGHLYVIATDTGLREEPDD